MIIIFHCTNMQFNHQFYNLDTTEMLLQKKFLVKTHFLFELSKWLMESWLHFLFAENL